MWEGEERTMQEQSHCPTCGSTKRNEFWAWTPSFGGRWIPWFKCADEWHLARATQAAPKSDKPWTGAFGTTKIYCDYCDGCGWYEGGRMLQTKCEKCNGKGVIYADALG